MPRIGIGSGASFVAKEKGNISGIESNLTVFPEKMRDTMGGIIKQGADGGSHIMANALVVVISFVIAVVFVKLILLATGHSGTPHAGAVPWARRRARTAAHTV